MAAESQWVVDVTDAEFEDKVIERSKTTPVVVDFWAPWCGPCKTLGPVLEALAEEHDGDFILAKVNTDVSPQFAGALGVRGIPSVKAFRDGRIVNEFVGALPAQEVRRFLETVVPSAADRFADQGIATLQQGDLEGAVALLGQALDTDARHPKALVGMGLVARHRAGAGVADAADDADPFAEARGYLERVPAGTPERAEADRLLAEIEITSEGGDAPDLASLQARVAEAPDDLAARYALALALFHHKDTDGALQNLLHIVKADRGFQDDAARKKMVQIFEVLGSDPLASQFRRELSKALF